MEITLMTGYASYVVCDVKTHRWSSSRTVSLHIIPRDEKTPPIELDIGLEDWLTLLTKITEQFQKEHI